MTWCWAASCPVGEQGADIARAAGGGAPASTRPCPGVQVNRFSALGPRSHQHGGGAGHAWPEQGHDNGGVESMSHVPMVPDGGAWPVDPAVTMCRCTSSRRAVSGRRDGQRVRHEPRRRRRLRRRVQKRAKAQLGSLTLLQIRSVPVGTRTASSCSNHNESCSRPPPCRRWPPLKTHRCRARGCRASMPSALQGVRRSRRSTTSVGAPRHRRRRGRDPDRHPKEFGEKAGLGARARMRSFALDGLGAGDDADRPRAGLGAGAEARRRGTVNSGWEMNEAFAGISCCARGRSKDAECMTNVNGGASRHGPSARRDRRR